MVSSLTQLLNIQYPILQAPIGSATTPELVAAVSNAGGLGMLSLSWKDLTTTREWIRRTKQLTNKPFAVNFVLTVAQEQRIQICIEEKVPIVSFFWGDGSPYIEMLHQHGIIVSQTIGNSEEAQLYAQKGIDFLIAQGWEAGGHVWGQVASSVLIPSAVDKVKVPVVAAGGIADGRGILAALCLGAAGACLGTRFLMSREAAVHSIYQDMISQASENDTVYAERLFNIGWDHAAHRVLRNSTVKMSEEAGKPEPGKRPGEGDIVGKKMNQEIIVRYSDDGPVLTHQGELEALAFYAGQSSGLINQVQPVEIIMQSLVSEVQALAQKLIYLGQK